MPLLPKVLPTVLSIFAFRLELAWLLVHNRYKLAESQERMVRARSNLFFIDHKAMPALLAEANARLLVRRDELLAAFDRVPLMLRTDDEATRAKRFAEQLRAAANEAEAERRKDQRPFLDGSKAVKTFFDGVSKPLGECLRQVEARLTEAARRARPSPATVPVPRPVVMTETGAPVVAAAPPPPVDGNDSPPMDAPELPMVWEVAHVDAAALDLEALRDLFTDRELAPVVQRWLRKHGPKPLRGATFHQVVRTRAHD